jgi:hypothetical protein
MTEASGRGGWDELLLWTSLQPNCIWNWQWTVCRSSQPNDREWEAVNGSSCHATTEYQKERERERERGFDCVAKKHQKQPDSLRLTLSHFRATGSEAKPTTWRPFETVQHLRRRNKPNIWPKARQCRSSAKVSKQAKAERQWMNKKVKQKTSQKS